jgi:glutamate N-acetyltransferase/amino-acid N-acetyltransferase
VSVTVPAGFAAGGVACGLKSPAAPDLALVATDDGRPVAAAAVFTSNRAAAAPVQVSKAHLRASEGQVAAVILNSGNANAATGESGRVAAVRMCATTAAGLGCRPEHVLVCSTGLIGIPLPADLVVAGIPDVLADRDPEGGPRAAGAIMTTDTFAKQVVVVGPGFTVGGMAKGAAMLAPHMVSPEGAPGGPGPAGAPGAPGAEHASATMLAVLTTDAIAVPAVLQVALADAVAQSFNQLSIDGATSTNDTVIVLASGRSGVAPDRAELTEALREACADLAGQMASDAEGATKVIRVRVTGAASASDAAGGARQVAQSQLVKCSWFGQDPYWGRIVSELGSAGIAFDIDRVSVSYGGITVCDGGVALAGVDQAALAVVMAEPTVEVVADLGLGDGEATILTADLTYAYIDENMRTS